MADLLLSLPTGLVLLAYLAIDIGTSDWNREDANEAGRRIVSVSAVYTLAAATFSIIYGEVSVFIPSPEFEGPVLTTIWTLSLIFLLASTLWLYGRARARSKHEIQARLNVADYIDRQIGFRLKPLEGMATEARTIFAELSGKVASLGEEVRKLLLAVEDQAKAIGHQTTTMMTIVENHEWREQKYREVLAQYNKWYEQRGEASKKLDFLINGADGMLEKFAMFSDQVDELLDSLGPEGREPSAEGGATAQLEQVGGPAPQNPTGPTSLVGKLTKEKGMTNREKGNRAQLQFSEEVLRKASKIHDTSFKEGAADFVFYFPDTRIAKAVGAFKALTLSEGGTRQRWIPRRKVLAEQRLAMKLGVPLILFVQNLLNGRIWAKVLPLEELKGFAGLTTPLMLMENDPKAEKTCKETLEMALQLL